MKMWCPPTPPQEENDVYLDQTMCFLYESQTMPDTQLPPVYVKKELKRVRSADVSPGIEGTYRLDLALSGWFPFLRTFNLSLIVNVQDGELLKCIGRKIHQAQHRGRSLTTQVLRYKKCGVT